MTASTDYSTIEWPTTYDFDSFSSALMHFPDTRAISEHERVSKFSALVTKKTGTSDTIRLPEPFNQIPYFIEFANRVNNAKTSMITDVFKTAKQEIMKLKEFVTNMATRDSNLRELIEKESNATREQLLADPQALENMVSGLYNTSASNKEKYTENYNRLKYYLQCVIWGKKIDKTQFTDEEKNSDLHGKFETLEKVAATLDSREKDFLINLVRNLVRCIVAVFTIRRTNLSFGTAECFKFSYYFKPMMITRLKELIVFEKNPFVNASETELDEKEDKVSIEQIKTVLKYEQIMSREFGHLIINVTMLR